jgi:4-amino-4-deoxy-L-arabinose transferase-like glycosyltransferase
MIKPWEPLTTSDRIWWIAVGAILLLAIWLRFVNLSFGLPQHLHADEWSQVEVARRIAEGDLNPHFFHYPTGFMYLLAFIYRVASLFYPNLELSTLYLIGRIVSVLFGTATVALVIFWGRLLSNRWVGVVAGGLLALLYTSIEQSHYAVIDSPMTFWATSTLVFLSMALLRSSPVTYLRFASVTAGIALATKYTAGLLILPLIVTAWLTIDTNQPFSNLWKRTLPWLLGLTGLALATSAAVLFWEKPQILQWASSLTTDGRIKREYLLLYNNFIKIFVVGGGFSFVMAGYFLIAPKLSFWRRFFHPEVFRLFAVVCVVFAFLSPYVFLEWRSSMKDVLYEYRHMRMGAAANYPEGSEEYLAAIAATSGVLPSIQPYWSLFSNEFGIAAIVFFGIGWFYLWRRSRKLVYILAPYTGMIMLIIFSWANWAKRYALPLYPILVIVIAVGIAHLVLSLRKKSITLAAIATGIIIVSLFISPVSHTRDGMANFRLPDTRELAWRWGSDYLPSKARLVKDANTPDFELAPKFFEVKKVFPYVLSNMTPQEVRENGFAYVVTTFSPKISDNLDSVPLERYETFIQIYKEIATFKPERGRSKGRTIHIYKLSDEE